MLGKLIKHEWLSTWKVPTALCIYIGILTALGCISFLSPMWQSEHIIIELIAGLSVVLYMFSLFALTITVFVYFVIRFYRNMYTNEGYLMHTLPVKPWELIFSKGLVFFIWSILSSLIMILSILLLVLTAASTIDGMTLSAAWSSFMEELPEISAMWEEMFGFGFVGYFVVIILSSIISVIYSILMIYTSISIGQIFNKHKVLASFIAYACINFIVQTITSLFQLPFMAMNIEENMSEFSNMFSFGIWGSLIICVVLAVVYAFVTNFIMSKKLNLD